MTADEGCPPRERRERDRACGWGGIAGVQVDNEARTLRLLLFGKAPVPAPEADDVAITGPGRVVRAVHVEVVASRPAGRYDELVVHLDRLGDRSPYEVALTGVDELDPRYARAAFTFTGDCGEESDCGATASCPPGEEDRAVIDYLAKDYASFRRLILDRLALTSPSWTDRQIPDLGVTLVELLAYVGDQLSYRQDAVATEAYLNTARLRTSVRRHLRLVDYRLHDGCNARTWVHLEVEEPGVLYAGTYRFVTAVPALDGRPMVSEGELRRRAPGGGYQVYEPVLKHDVPVSPARNRIRLWTWGGEECCLPRGATTATLVDGWCDEERSERLLGLCPGDVVIFEEVRGPLTGVPGDADVTHRQAVRLTEVEELDDPVYDQPLLRVSWACADALTFDLCLASIGGEECCLFEDVSVARGNVVLVDHGATGTGRLTVPGGELGPVRCEGLGRPGRDPVRVRFEPELPLAPLTRRAPYPAPETVAAGQALTLAGIPTGSAPRPRQVARLARLTAQARLGLPLDADDAAEVAATWGAGAELDPDGPVAAGPASAALTQDPRTAPAQLWLTSDGVTWTVRADLIGSGPEDPHVVVEVDDEGRSHLRFGDGTYGRGVRPGQHFDLRMRIGNGTAGNVGPEAVAHLVAARPIAVPVTGVRNPLAATGGIDPEPVADARLLGPTAYRHRLVRAVTAEDYATIAAAQPGVQSAATDLAWTGGWYEADVAIDPLRGRCGEEFSLEAARTRLEQVRRIGHDLRADPPRQVAVDLGLRVCLAVTASRSAATVALRARLGDAPGGMFDPDRLTFGTGLYVSRILAEAMAVPGVVSASVVRLARTVSTGPPVPAGGALAFGPLEIPSAGTLTLDLVGGR
ncbi:putative baseplate assembly protein [Nonomuraea sp. NPDC050153]|uniref:putative baseplate assembly protein n=1 Tax=Nonomuraea sp. NPDC050153 TaxID=3364359 RepID=UPI00378AC490